MLASSFLDTAIGIIFVFLLLSIIATTINEIILSIVNMRGRMLLDGLKTLLSDDNLTGLVPQIYNHGKVYGLFKGKFGLQAAPGSKPDDKKNEPSRTTKQNLPTYIPSANFASAFLGVLKDLAPKADQDAVGTAQQTAAKAAADAKTILDNAAAILADSAKSTQDKETARQAASLAQAAAELAASAANGKLFTVLEGSVKSLNNDKVAQPMLAILATADNDINKLKSGVEDWYNSAMDRVSGWYKYHTQKVLFGIGLGLAIALNANTVEIVRQVSTNDALRQSIVAAATKAQPQAQPNQSQQSATDQSVGDVRTAWQAGHAYTINDSICSNPTEGCTSGNNNVQRVIKVSDDAKSGATEPTWPASPGASVQDNNVTWQNVGHAFSRVCRLISLGKSR